MLKLSQVLAQAKGAMQDNRHSLGAMVITGAAVGGVAYVGGKAMLTTGAIVGGGLFATAVVYLASKSLLAVGEGVASTIADAVHSVEEQMRRPTPAREVAVS